MTILILAVYFHHVILVMFYCQFFCIYEMLMCSFQEPTDLVAKEVGPGSVMFLWKSRGAASYFQVRTQLLTSVNAIKCDAENFSP